MSRLPVSVIIPHYNRPDFLRAALDSVLAQTCPPSEIIIVDDCSEPGAANQLRKFQNVARIHANPVNVGAAESRNVGVGLASNPWLAFLDDDDLYHPRKLEYQWAYVNRHPDCEVLGGPLLHLAPSGDTEVWGYREERTLGLRDALLFTASSMCTMLIQRKAFYRAGQLDKTFRNMADLEFGIRVLSAGCRMEILPEPLVTYRHGGRPELSLEWGNTCKSHFRIVHKHRKLYRQEFGSFGEWQEYARRAQFYGLRKGGVMGRSLWLTGLALRAFVGKVEITQPLRPADMTAPDTGKCASHPPVLS